MTDNTRVALVTGGSQGLGEQLVHALAQHGWWVITDGRNRQRLQQATEANAAAAQRITAIRGDIADDDHRRELVAAVRSAGRLDLLVHNASTLGPTPLRPLTEHGGDDVAAVFAVNAFAPLAMTTALLPQLISADGAVIAVTSDAAAEHYPTWGPYGASKLALEHLMLTVASENPVTAYVVDPGDMRTRMHADAFAGQDISDRPLPATVVPHLLGLLQIRPPSGRYLAAELPVEEPAHGVPA